MTNDRIVKTLSTWISNIEWCLENAPMTDLDVARDAFSAVLDLLKPQNDEGVYCEP